TRSAAGRTGGSASATRFQHGELPGRDPGIVERPADQGGDAQGDPEIGPEDEDSVRSQIDHAPAPCAALRCNVITLRRLTSVCMALSCSVTNRNVNAKNMTKSGTRMEPGMDGPSARNTLAGWCRVLHQ